MMSYQTFIWIEYASFLLLVFCSVTEFLSRGWQNRRREILNGFSGASARIYLASFQPSAPTQRRKPWTWRTYEELEPLKRLDYYYHAEFSRWRFMTPFVLLMFVMAALLLWCATTVMGWFAGDAFTRQPHSAMLPVESVFAILGGYMWVAYYLVDRSSRERLLPSDLYWASFRMLIVTPLAYSIAQAFNVVLAVPLSFFLGTFPTETVMTIGRRFVTRQLGAADGDEKPDRIVSLPSVDRPTYETLASEGITNLYKLAYCDPVKVTFRTGLDFSYVLVAASQSLAYIYFRDKADIAVRYGLDGAGECLNLWQRLTSEDEAEASEAKALLASLKDALGVSEEGCRNLIREIAEDPFTEFHAQCWLDRAERVQNA